MKKTLRFLVAVLAVTTVSNIAYARTMVENNPCQGVSCGTTTECQKIWEQCVCWGIAWPPVCIKWVGEQ